jgi:hypothetical protein
VENERSSRWRSQLQSQSRVISRQQAQDAGWPDRTIDRRLRSGTWRRLHRGTYATFTGDASREAKLWAAVLRAGPGAVLSHETAAEVHGLTDKPKSQIHISVPAQRNPGRLRRIPGVIIHRSRRLVPEWQPPWHLPRTTVEDTVLDLIATARTFDDAYGWISSAVGSRLTSPQSLSKALAARKRIRWRDWITAALEDAADGVHSPLERNYVHGVEQAHRLPTAQRQAKRRHGSGPATWTTCTNTASASSSTELRPTRRKAAGGIPAGTTPTWSREPRRLGTAGPTPPCTAAGPL